MKGKNPNRRGKSKIEKSLAQDDDFSGSAAWEVVSCHLTYSALT